MLDAIITLIQSQQKKEMSEDEKFKWALRLVALGPDRTLSYLEKIIKKSEKEK